MCCWSFAMAGGSPNASDHDGLQGVWLAQSESQNGRTWDVTYQYVFDGDRLTFRDENGKVAKYTFKLETAGDLKLMTITPEEASADSGPVSVAYELEADALTIVIAPAGSRPTEISDRNDQELIVCTRSSR